MIFGCCFSYKNSSAEEPMQRTNGAFYASIHSDLDAALALFKWGLLHHLMLGLLQPYASSNLKALKSEVYALKGD
jgi:hypothetical protein